MFEYRFEKIKKVKDEEKREIELRFNDAYSRLEQIGTHLIDLLNEKQQLLKLSEEKLKQSTAIHALRGMNVRINQLQAKIHDLEFQYETQKGTVKEIRMDLTERATELKKYEKHRWRLEQIYKEAAKKTEMKFMDETATQQYIRN